VKVFALVQIEYGGKNRLFFILGYFMVKIDHFLEKWIFSLFTKK